MQQQSSVALLLAALSLGANAEAATIEIAYPAMERVIVRNVMTEGGRFYMRGSAATPCQHAFVQEPRVQASSGRLRITLLFSGKEGVEVAGRCLGAGDNFNVEISGVPTYAEGFLYLADLRLESSERAYFKVVADLIRDELEENLRFSIKDAIAAVAETSAASGVGRFSIENVRVNELRATDEALRFSIDFAATLR